MAVDILWKDRCVLATYRGEVTHDNIVESYRRIEGDHRFDELHFSIIDLTELSPAVMHEHLLEEIAAENWAASATNRRLNTAVVALHPEIVEAINRYQSLMPVPRHIPDVRVCGSVDEARAAFGVGIGFTP